MAQEPPEDHKCKDKFLVQSALLPPSLANLPPADIVSGYVCVWMLSLFSNLISAHRCQR